jgi:NAD(P)-dependent dehydrogenase (short-subunit alcohol dehydrogenase family)
MQYVVTGGNRGIGLEFVDQLTARGDSVIATARNPSDARELQLLADERDVEIFALDISEPESVSAFGRELADRSIDVLINNAGVLHRGGGPHEGFEFGEIQTDFEVNVKGTLRVVEALLDNVAAEGGGKIVNLTSKMGSIADNGSGGSYAYRISKAALNMATKSLAIDLEDDNIAAFVVHPGWVQTRMGGDGALITTEESVTNLLARIDEAGTEESGQFLEWNGGEIPW